MSFGGDDCIQPSDENQSSSTQSNEGHGLLALLGSERMNGLCIYVPTCSSSSQEPHQSSRQNNIISDEEEDTNAAYESNFEHPWLPKISSQGVVISKRIPVPLSVFDSTIISNTGVSETSNPTVSYIFENVGSIFSGSENVPDSEACNALSLISSIDLHRFPVHSQIPRGIQHLLQWPFLLALQFSLNSGSSTAQQGQVSIYRGDDQLQNETGINFMPRQLVESALYMRRPGNNLVEGSVPQMILTAGNEMSLRLVSEDVQVFSQSSSLFYTTEAHNHFRDTWLDVDNMSYEELLALEDHIGYVSTGLSEEAVFMSLKHSKYFLFAEENAQKESCSICQEDYVEEDGLGTLDCGHGFHFACITQWLRCKNICPICKSTGLYTTSP